MENISAFMKVSLHILLEWSDCIFWQHSHWIGNELMMMMMIDRFLEWIWRFVVRVRYWMIVTPKNERFVNYHTAYLSIGFSVVGGLFWALPPVIGWWVDQENDLNIDKISHCHSKDRKNEIHRWDERLSFLIFFFNYLSS